MRDVTNVIRSLSEYCLNENYLTNTILFVYSVSFNVENGGHITILTILLDLI